MYDLIQGKLIRKTVSHVVILAAGIGYKITIPPSLFTEQENSEVVLYLSFIIRENLQQLYGFQEISQRDLFEMMLTVSGVGPKVALSLVEHAPISKLKQWILEKNTTALASVPGLGKKTAEKVILEFKDKIGKLPSSEALCSESEDAKKALIALGFTPKKAEAKIAFLKDKFKGCDVETLVSMALKEGS